MPMLLDDGGVKVFFFFFFTALLGAPLVIYNINLQYNTPHKKKKAKTQKG